MNSVFQLEQRAQINNVTETSRAGQDTQAIKEDFNTRSIKRLYRTTLDTREMEIELQLKVATAKRDTVVADLWQHKLEHSATRNGGRLLVPDLSRNQLHVGRGPHKA
jgi:cyclopropane fatty-acyl-phospholipid synthase-like methyltransferase